MANRLGKALKRGMKDVGDWQGWPTIIELYDQITYTKYPKDTQSIFTVLFNTGARRAEAPLIKLKQVDIRSTGVVINGAKTLKKKKENESYRTIRISFHRNPMAAIFKDYVEDLDEKNIFLLPGLKPFTRVPLYDRALSGATIYNRLSDIPGGALFNGGSVFPHSLRGLCAKMLVAEYDFDVHNLVSWFNWSSANSAIIYTATRDLSKKLKM